MCLNIFLGGVTIRRHDDRGSGMAEYLLCDSTIYVRNLSYNKQIGLRICIDGIWTDFFFIYSSSLATRGGNFYEIWCQNPACIELKELPLGTTPPIPPQLFRFAAFYHNLDTNSWYWDNNNGWDYNIVVP